MYQVKEKVEQVDLMETVKKIENWVITGNTEGTWFYQTNKNNNGEN